MVRLFRWILTTSVVLALQVDAFAWSAGGHHLIAVLAFRQLEPQRQDEIIRILKTHPRFAEDFSKPAKVQNENEWLIGRAGYWPDVVRSGSGRSYHRSTWHYELGATKVVGTVNNVPAFPGDLPAGATLDTQALHIAQAIKLCDGILADANAKDSDRAVAICWLCHLVADSHQPCHAGSLYVEHVFDKADGDRGANSIPTKQSKNMHALWDGLLGSSYSESAVQRRALEVVALANEEPLRVDGTPVDWLAESRQVAIDIVYADEVMEPITVAMRANSSEIAELNLSEEYLKRAGRVAQLRAAQAAARLAGFLR